MGDSDADAESEYDYEEELNADALAGVDDPNAQVGPMNIFQAAVL